MARHVMIVAALAGFAARAYAGGPPPVYVVVDRVTLEPSAGAPERVRIEGSFVRLESGPIRPKADLVSIETADSAPPAIMTLASPRCRK